MPLAVKDLVVDVAITDFVEQECRVLYSGPSYDPSTKDKDHYKSEKNVIRLHLCLMGETHPALSPLSVDVATDREYRVYRYDWVVGIRGLTRWNWRSKVRGEALVVQLALRPQASNIGCTCVAAKLNVLPPSRRTSTWSEINPNTVAEITTGTVDLAAKATGIPLAGVATKAAAAVSNALTSRTRWKTNWYINQYVDQADQAVSWHIRRNVLDEFGPLLRGSLMLAFHGSVREERTAEAGSIRLRMKPLLAFWRGFRHTRYFGDDLTYVHPMKLVEDQKQLELSITPGEYTQVDRGVASQSETSREDARNP